MWISSKLSYLKIKIFVNTVGKWLAYVCMWADFTSPVKLWHNRTVSGEKNCVFFISWISQEITIRFSWNLLQLILTLQTMNYRKIEFLKSFLLFLPTLSNVIQCPTWVRSPLMYWHFLWFYCLRTHVKSSVDLRVLS